MGGEGRGEWNDGGESSQHFGSTPATPPGSISYLFLSKNIGLHPVQKFKLVQQRYVALVNIGQYANAKLSDGTI